MFEVIGVHYRHITVLFSSVYNNLNNTWHSLHCLCYFLSHTMTGFTSNLIQSLLIIKIYNNIHVALWTALSQLQCCINKIKTGESIYNIHKRYSVAYSIYRLIWIELSFSKRVYSLSRNIVEFLSAYASQGGQLPWCGVWTLSLNSLMHNAWTPRISNSSRTICNSFM